MAVKLRLVRMGKKKQPTYRVVAADSRRARSGAFLEVVGTYQPRGLSSAEPDTVVSIDNEKAVRWLRQGAQPTDRVARLLETSGAMTVFRAGPSVVVDATPAPAPDPAPAAVEATEDPAPGAVVAEESEAPSEVAES